MDTIQNNDLVVDSREIARFLGMTYNSINNMIKKYLNDLQFYGEIKFEVEITIDGARIKYCYLNEEQTNVLLIGFTRNIEQVLECKKELYKFFHPPIDDLANYAYFWLDGLV